jgi:phage portal protein BeeE
MALLELSQWTESRIAVALGVPPFLAGLPSGGDSLTYSNVSQLFDFHDRSSLRPKANSVMAALSAWALPLGQSCELNREEYSRPGMKERAEAYQILHSLGVISTEQIQAAERLHSDSAASSLAGGTSDEAGPSETTPAAAEPTGGDDT